MTEYVGNISEHFTWAEVLGSPTARHQGIDNTLPEELKPNARRSARTMEAVRSILDDVVHVTSWYRCPQLNEAIGGSKTSAHKRALAVDFKPKTLDLDVAFERLAASDLDFDQLIIERTRDGARWIHVGLTEGVARREVLAAAGDHLGGTMAFRRIAAG